MSTATKAAPVAAFDDRSEKLLKTLTPRAQSQARAFLQRVRGAGMDARIIGGTRTYAEQDALFAQGRSKPGNRVTNARGGFSNHNFAVAWDIGIFVGGKYLEDSLLYAKAGKIGRDMGLEWGGDWRSLVDEPHYQCRTGKTLAQLRDIVAENGGDITRAIGAVDKLVQPLVGEVLVPAPAGGAVWEVSIGGETVDNFVIDAGSIWVPAREAILFLRGQEKSHHIGFDKPLGVLTLNGKPLRDENGLAVPAKLRGDDAFARVRDLSDALGGTLTVDNEKRLINVV